jgi:hypothetical protein
MSYSTANPPGLIAQGVSRGTNKESRLWQYSSADDLATVTAAGYFSNGYSLGLRTGDIIQVVDNDGINSFNLLVTAEDSANDTVTVTSTLAQELLASGAVNPGVSSVELNHASVIIAATIADSKNHQGLFVVKDTSASGTAAHTLTLTSGTFDGTNTVATLNAPNEALVVWFDSAGNGTIVENVGVVVLS